MCVRITSYTGWFLYLNGKGLTLTGRNNKKKKKCMRPPLFPLPQKEPFETFSFKKRFNFN